MSNVVNANVGGFIPPISPENGDGYDWVYHICNKHHNQNMMI